MTLVLYLHFKDGLLLMADKLADINGVQGTSYKKIQIHEKNDVSLIFGISGKSWQI